MGRCLLIAGLVCLSMGAGRAAFDPVPGVSVVQDGAADVLCEVVMPMPFGAFVAYGYKGADFLRLTGVAANDIEDDRIKSTVILATRDGELLKTLKEEGRDLNSDPQAQEAMARLKAYTGELNQGEEYTALRVIRVTDKNWGVSVAKVGRDKLIGLALGKVFGSDKLKAVVGGNLGEFINTSGWPAMETRGALVKAFAADWSHAILGSSVDEFIGKVLDHVDEMARDKAVEDIMKRNPSSGTTALRFLVQPPAVAAASAPVAVAAPIPVAEVHISDPVTYSMRGADEVTRERYNAPPIHIQPSTITHGYDADAPTSAWQIQMHQDYANFPYGNSNSKSSWDGNNKDLNQ